MLDEYTPEMEEANKNVSFENELLNSPIKQGVGEVDVFGETWDVNMILKGNYWGRTIYTTDKICKLFLKWNLERQKKYLRKKNPLDFDLSWLILIIIGGIGALLFIIFGLPKLGM